MLGKKKAMALGLALLVALGAAGCSKKTAAPGGAVKVKVMQAIKRDTPLTYEYTGFVEAKDQVSIKSKVTGTIIKKYVNGGDYVEADSFFTKSILGPMKPMCSMLRPI